MSLHFSIAHACVFGAQGFEELVLRQQQQNPTTKRIRMSQEQLDREARLAQPENADPEDSKKKRYKRKSKKR